ncbi:hypothetical protein [Chryseobacterium daecheongense]|uniref:DoxX family protein n=1 Tax=Chryseobacterium daecheongense TaxID=192389 RepID=A0A3N0W7D7_9FLAO|nr:hypothetical protein [Chryseobacterium daecheongense]ROI00049.1 hypothetical protein EGI05_03935 [Chryseobacterium daecheongense]TDX95012.1 hypothetical protein BCF50_0785 [Chryseobacterium daecheongense]
MIKNIISLLLLIFSVLLNFKHGWDTFNYKSNPESVKAMADLGITETAIPFLGSLAIITGILLLFPRTFFYGNVLNALLITLIMALAARSENYKMILLEIPFLFMPLIMIWLKYPFKN